MSNVSMIDGHIDEPKMTDNEIIKGYCKKKLCPPAQEIINRQKAEIKELNRVIKKFKATKERHRTEIARLTKLLIKWKKVFIPKDYDPNDDLLFLSVDVKDVNKLLKEMVGE